MEAAAAFPVSAELILGPLSYKSGAIVNTPNVCKMFWVLYVYYRSSAKY
jgi:hypothetical protein